MSPTEFDLRAALRDGEGDDPSVDRIVAGAEAARSHLRTRVLSTAAAAVIVAGVAVGGVALVSHSGDHDGSDPAHGAVAAAAQASAATSAASSSAAKGAAGGTAPLPASAGTRSGSSSPARCPSSFPHTLLPGGGSPGQFGASGKLFAKPVAAITICTYSDVQVTPAASSPGRSVLKGSAARDLADSLENASKTALRGMCPDYIVADAPSLAIIAVSTDGTVLPAVTTSLGRPACHTQVSNGTVVRYGWTPPASVNSILRSTASVPSAGVSSTSH